MSPVIGIINEAQHGGVDFTRDFDLVVKVRKGVIHTYAKNSSSKADPCIECERYEKLILASQMRREAEDQ